MCSASEFTFAAPTLVYVCYSFPGNALVVLHKERDIDSCFVPDMFSCCTPLIRDHHDVLCGHPASLDFRKPFLHSFLQEYFIITCSREKTMGKIVLTVNGKEVKDGRTAISNAKVRLFKHKSSFSAILLIIFYSLYELTNRQTWLLL